MEDKQGTRRACKLFGKEERVIVNAIRKNLRTSDVKLKEELLKNCNVDLSNRTVQRTLNNHGYSSRIVKKKPVISGAKNLKEENLLFCTKTRTYRSGNKLCLQMKVSTRYLSTKSLAEKKVLL